MAAALLHEPEILFLDEPTSGADPLARREFWRRITALAEQGVTVMVTTHFMEEAEYCDRVAILDAGRIWLRGTPAEIRGRRSPNGSESRPWRMRLSPSSKRRAPVNPSRNRRLSEVDMTYARPYQPATTAGFRSSKVRRVWSLVRKEARQIIRDPSSIAIGIVLPVLLILLFGYGLSLDVKNVPVAVVLEDPSPAATELAAGFQLSPYFDVQLHDLDAAGQELMLARQVDGDCPHPPGLRPAAEPSGTPRCRSSSMAPMPTAPASSRRYAQGAVGQWAAPGRRGARMWPAGRWSCRAACGLTRPTRAATSWFRA